MMLKLSLLVFAVFFVVSMNPVYAQHHSGSLAPPIDFGGMQVALSSILSPEDFTIEDSKSANLAIRFFDSLTNTNIKSVTYRVQIFQGDKLVANEYFYDEDGKLDLEIRPIAGCQDENLWKCTKYFGEKHAIAGAYYGRGDSRPIIQGPVFDQSGQYNVKVSIVGATNPKTMTTSDLQFETFLSIPQKQTFLIQTASAQEFPVKIKSFDGKIINFNFDESTNTISYETPFDWTHSKHNVSGTKQAIYLEKDFQAFKQGHDIDLYVDGVKLQDGSSLFEVTPTGKSIIRVNIPHEEIMLIHNKLGGGHPDKNTINIKIVPGEQTDLNQMDFSFENGNTAKITWNAKLNAGQKIPFTFSFFNENGVPAKDILYAYSVIDHSGKELSSNIGSSATYIGVLAPLGINQESILIPSEGKYQMKLILTGQEGKNYERFFSQKAEFSMEIQSGKHAENIMTIPAWIKSNAGWWADGAIDDNSFVQGIQHLIKEGIIQIPATVQTTSASSNEIPAWIKSNAGWWADGAIDDNSFVQGIQHLIKEGIIRVN